MTPQKLLQHYFGYSQFRSTQAEIIHSVIEKKDTLVIMPTGGGKSLCYQIPGLFFPHTTLVISPLISLMQDQVQALTQKNIPAVYLNSSLTARELKKIYAAINQYKFIYLAPERLHSQEWLHISKKLHISLIAIDEAHCISEWGHDFRPPYMQITQYVEQLSVQPPIIALTATATPRTKQEIITSLKLKSPQVFQGSFTRNNLHLTIQKYPTLFEKELTLLKILYKHHNQSGIIYTQTRQQSEEIAQLINFYNPAFGCQRYHAGLDAETRKSIQEQFIGNTIRLITATNAFGMGVDKPDVRFVIHLGPSASIENYYQEVGRAGRDGHISDCYLLYHQHDLTVCHQLLQESESQQTSHKQKKLTALINMIESKQCVTTSLKTYFADTAPPDKNVPCTCSRCTNRLLDFTTKQKKVIQRLVSFRTKISNHYHLHKNKIMTDQVIALLAILTPTSQQELLKIPGIGQGWVDQWADDIIPLV